MNYVTPAFPIGTVAYLYNSHSDSIQRVTITGIACSCGPSYDLAPGVWNIEYACLVAGSDAAVYETEDNLYPSADTAFYSRPMGAPDDEPGEPDGPLVMPRALTDAQAAGRSYGGSTD